MKRGGKKMMPKGGKVVGRKAGAAKARGQMLQHDKGVQARGSKGYAKRLKDAAL
jgi:hypothetical protein